MNPTAEARSLGAMAAVQKAPMTPVAPPSSADPPSANVPVAGQKPVSDSVSISDAARLRAADEPPRTQGPRQSLGPQGQGSEMSQAQQIMADLRSSFFAREGEEGFDQRLDFNSDGVINAGDLGVFREKMAGRPMPAEPEAMPPPSLDSIRDAFFTQAGEDGFDASADLNGDGVVNVQDLGLYRQSMADSSQPTQPVPAPLDGATSGTATQGVSESLGSPGTSSPVVGDGNVAGPTAQSVAVPNVAATGSEAGNSTAADPSSTRLNLLDQLREAFFSRRGDDRFDASLDANKDGVLNVGDFISIRDSV